MYALLDDCDATAQRPSSRLHTGFAAEHRCEDPQALDAAWAQVGAELHRAWALVACNPLRGVLPSRLRQPAVA